MSARTARGGLLQVPVMMDIQALARQDFSGLTKDQKKKAITQLKQIMAMVDPKGKIPMGSDISYFPKKQIAAIDLTDYYAADGDEHTTSLADLDDFVPMFSDGKNSSCYGNLETSCISEITEIEYDDDDHEVMAYDKKFDIDRCLECAESNLAKLQELIEAVKTAKAQGAKYFAAVDTNDCDWDSSQVE